MKHRLKLLIVIFILLLYANFCFLQNKATLDDNTIAVVGKKKILFEDFIQRYMDYLITTGLNDNYQIRLSVLNNMINETLLLHYDNNDAVYKNSEYNIEVAWAKKQTILAYLKDQEIYAKKKTYESYINKIFNQNKIEFNEECLKQILEKLQVQNLQEKPRTTPKSNLVCAKYENKIYKRSDIESQINTIPYYHKEKIITLDALKSAAAGFILQEKLLSIAKTKKYDKNPLVTETFKKLQNNIFLKYKRKEISERAMLPDSVVRNYYRDSIHLFSTEEELNLQEIIVDDQNLADSLVKLISDGSDFGELAQIHSVRNWSAANKGIMGYDHLSRYGFLKDRFWNSEIGELIGPIKVDERYGIFKVLGKKQSQPVDFNLIKDGVERVVKLEQQTKFVREHLENLQKKVLFEINEEVLKNYSFTEK